MKLVEYRDLGIMKSTKQRKQEMKSKIRMENSAEKVIPNKILTKVESVC